VDYSGIKIYGVIGMFKKYRISLLGV